MSIIFNSPILFNPAMVRYAKTVKNVAKSVKARGSYLRVHFKNTHEVGAALAGMNLKKAFAYLEDVKQQKRCIPFRRFAGGTGRTGQASEFGTTRGRWPIKSVEFVLGLLKNAESNAVVSISSSSFSRFPPYHLIMPITATTSMSGLTNLSWIDNSKLLEKIWKQFRKIFSLPLTHSQQILVALDVHCSELFSFSVFFSLRPRS